MAQVMSDRETALLTKLVNSRQTTLALLERLEPDLWDASVQGEDGPWRASDVIRHIAAAERDMSRLVTNICAGSPGASEDFDLARWNARSIRRAADQNAAELKEAMAANRLALLSLIASLTPEDWAKIGRHGTLRMMSVEQILNLIAEHEQAHVQELANALGLN